MLFLNKALLASLCLVAVVQAVRAADPATEASSVFKRRAQAITAMGVEDLEGKAVPKCSETKTGDGPGDAPFNLKLATTAPVAIGGSPGRMIATFRLVDGSHDDFRKGDEVPGVGKISSIGEKAVRFTNGRTMRVEGLID